MTRNHTIAELAQMARDGDPTDEDAAEAAILLPSLHDPLDRYDALFVIGKACDTRHEDLVASFLESPDDPMLARLAIQILCSWWGIGSRYAARVREFVVGIAWDLETGGYARSVAISGAGLILREHTDPLLLAALLEVFDSDPSDDMRRQAYSALLRAAGRDWNSIPGTGSDSWRTNPDTAVIEILRRRARPAP
jgi:hypothetical protein